MRKTSDGHPGCLKKPQPQPERLHPKSPARQDGVLRTHDSGFRIFRCGSRFLCQQHGGPTKQTVVLHGQGGDIGKDIRVVLAEVQAVRHRESI